MAFTITFHPIISKPLVTKTIEADRVFPEDRFFRFQQGQQFVAYVSADSVLSVEETRVK